MRQVKFWIRQEGDLIFKQIRQPRTKKEKSQKNTNHSSKSSVRFQELYTMILLEMLERYMCDSFR